MYNVKMPTNSLVGEQLKLDITGLKEGMKVYIGIQDLKPEQDKNSLMAISVREKA